MNRTIRRILAAVVMAALLVQPVLAQDAPPAKVPPLKLKSETTATLLSVVLTAIPVVGLIWGNGWPGWNEAAHWASIFGFGTLVGPATGLFYGGFEGRAWLGIGIRALAAAAMTALGYNPVTGFLAIGCFTIVIISALSDIFSVGPMIHRRNEALRKATLTLAPAYVPNNRVAGIQFRLSF